MLFCEFTWVSLVIANTDFHQVKNLLRQFHRTLVLEQKLRNHNKFSKTIKEFLVTRTYLQSEPTT